MSGGMGTDSMRGRAGDAATGGVMRRMVRPARPVRPTGADGGALRKATPRVVDRVAGLSVAMGGHAVDTLSRDDLALALPEGALVLRLSPNEARAGLAPLAEPGADGLAWLGADLFAALVERRLTGAVRPAAAPPRPSTPLDAVICGELVEALCDAPGVADGMAMRVAGHLREPDLAVVLPELPFRVMRLALRLMGAGDRGGEIGLALPDPPPPEERPRAEGLARPDLLGCRAELAAALPPVVLPWERILRLAPGDLVELPHGALDAVQVRTIDGAPVSGGRLGRMGEARAVRLLAPSLGAPERGGGLLGPSDAPPDGQAKGSALSTEVAGDLG